MSLNAWLRDEIYSRCGIPSSARISSVKWFSVNMLIIAFTSGKFVICDSSNLEAIDLESFQVFSGPLYITSVPKARIFFIEESATIIEPDSRTKKSDSVLQSYLKSPEVEFSLQFCCLNLTTPTGIN